MPLDHYVSQVHLRNFYSPALDGRMMYATRKSNLQVFPCKSEDVCRIQNGSTNTYLQHERAIEEFLPVVERSYNASLVKLREDKIDADSIYAMAGFASYVASCSPAAMRIHSDPLKSVMESTANILDRDGKLPRAPEELGSKSLSELLADGTVRISIDQKYPQALGIESIVSRVSVWGNSAWEILHNREDHSPFFTSDFPIAIEVPKLAMSLNWIVPLAPDLAIRIIPNMKLSRTDVDLSFSKLSYKHRNLRHTDVAKINRLLVQCAEDFVFYRDNAPWVAGFIAKYRNYRVETVSSRIPDESGFSSISTQRIVEYRQNPIKGDFPAK